jgi:quinolinate synthase
VESRKVDLAERIKRSKSERNAVILAHNYQRGEVQDIADFVGDSLDLSQRAASTDADVIVFCGVHFMAETASILSPTKTVLLPDKNAGCPMADMITAEKLRKRKQELPGAVVVCYVNSSAEVKAESDFCCTSANAVNLVGRLDTQEVLFVPDMYLGQYVSTRTAKKVLVYPGFCPTHTRIQAGHITRLRERHPNATVMVHPECQPDVIALADETLSTSGMCRYAGETDAEEIVVGTEVGIIHRLARENPGKTFIPATEQAVCPNMKLTTLEKVLRSLEEMAPQVSVPEDVRIRARRAVDRMLEVGRT